MKDNDPFDDLPLTEFKLPEEFLTKIFELNCGNFEITNSPISFVRLPISKSVEYIYAFLIPFFVSASITTPFKI